MGCMCVWLTNRRNGRLQTPTSSLLGASGGAVAATANSLMGVVVSLKTSDTSWVMASCIWAFRSLKILFTNENFQNYRKSTSATALTSLTHSSTRPVFHSINICGVSSMYKAPSWHGTGVFFKRGILPSKGLVSRRRGQTWPTFPYRLFHPIKKSSLLPWWPLQNDTETESWGWAPRRPWGRQSSSPFPVPEGTTLTIVRTVCWRQCQTSKHFLILRGEKSRMGIIF